MLSTSSTPLPQPVEEVKPTDLNKKKDSNDMDMLEKWINHDHHSYHLDFLSPTQAYDIRSALVLWYRANRRKLPWRGDGVYMNCLQENIYLQYCMNDLFRSSLPTSNPFFSFLY